MPRHEPEAEEEQSLVFILESCYFCANLRRMTKKKTGKKDSLAKTVEQPESLKPLQQ